jgi:osmotically-inducible protein OsmY
MNRTTGNSLSMLGGALLGAAAMYLMDPEAGKRRRQYLGEVAEDAAHDYGAKFGAAWGAVRDKAGDLGGRLGDFGSAAADSTRDAAHYYSKRSRKLADRAAKTSRGWFDSASEAAGDWTHRAGDAIGSPRSWLGMEEEHHYGRNAAGVSLAGLGVLALGGGLMYFLDARQGRGRRARAIDQATSIINRTGRNFFRLGRDLRNRARGVAAETRGRYFEGDAVSADQLLHRVRADLGHVNSHPAAIQVMTDNQGTVTLHGRVLASEADATCACVRAVPGVNELVNLMTTVDSADALNDSGSPVTSMNTTL